MVLNRKRQVIFKIIAILIPFIVLISVEIILRGIGYGYNTTLFIEDPSQKGTFITNTQISKLFFSNQKNARVGISQSFKKIKPPHTFRIFVLGESSAYGFPFTPRASFARMLEDRLATTFQDQNIEVINLSVTALNSFAFLTFGDEIVKMNPDAILIYGGHNEYYGAMGAGSSQRVGSNRNIVKLIIGRKKFRIIQLCFDFSESIKTFFSKFKQKANKSFMFRMAREQEIVYDSDIYLQGIAQFRNNMDELLSQFGKREIPVFMSTLVSNIKDQKPFISTLKNKSDSAQFLRIFRQGEKAFAGKDYSTFSSCFEAGNKIDSTYAMNHFLMGKLCFEKGDYAKAERYFANSKELDALRFRAPDAINKEICQFSKKYKNVYLVDALAGFKAVSQAGILGDNMFMDHLHPNIYGNFLLSDAFYNVMLHSKVLGSKADTVSFSDAWKDLPVTEVDSIYGAYTNVALKEQWPFYEQGNFTPDTTNYPERLTVMMFKNEIGMGMAMDSLYRYYTTQNNVEKAVKVVKSLALEYPHDTRFSLQTASLYGLLSKFEQSTLYYKRAFNEFPNVEVARKIVFNLLQLDKPKETGYYLKYLEEKQPGDPMTNLLLKKTEDVVRLKAQLLADPANSNAIFGLAEYYLFLRNSTEAKKYLDKAIANYPDNQQTIKLKASFNQLNSGKPETNNLKSLKR